MSTTKIAITKILELKWAIKGIFDCLNTKIQFLKLLY